MTIELYEKLSDYRLKQREIDGLLPPSFYESKEVFESACVLLFLKAVGANPDKKIQKQIGFSDVKLVKQYIKKFFKNESEKQKLSDLLVPSKNFFKADKKLLKFWCLLGKFSTDLNKLQNAKAIIVFFSELTKIKIRHARMVATLCVYSFMTGLMDAGNLAAKNRKLAKKVLSESNSENKRSENRTDASELKKIKNEISNLLKTAFEKIFVHRYRDVSEVIREESVFFLGEWVNKFPSMFLKDNKIKYFGWLLSDRSKPVRKAALSALCKVYNRKSNVKKLSAFTERYFARILEMLRDKSPGVVSAAIRLISIFFKKNLLDQTDDDAMVNLLWHRLLKVRYSAANFFMLETFKEDILKDDITTMNKVIELCDRGKDLESFEFYRVFTFVGNFLEKIPLFLDWERLFNLIVDFGEGNNSEMKTIKDKEDKDEKGTEDFTEDKKEEKENKEEESKAKRRKIKIYLEDSKRSTFFNVLKSVAIYEEALKLKFEDEKPDKILLGDLTINVLEFYPDLLRRHKSERDCIIPLLSIAEHLDFKQVEQSCYLERADSLRDALSLLFEFSEDPKLINGVSKTLSVLCMKDRKMAPYFQKFQKSLSSRLFKNYSELPKFCLQTLNQNKDSFETQMKEVSSLFMRQSSLLKFDSEENEGLKNSAREFVEKAKNAITKENSEISENLKALELALKPALEILYWVLFKKLRKIRLSNLFGKRRRVEEKGSNNEVNEKPGSNNEEELNNEELKAKKELKYLAETWKRVLINGTDATKFLCFKQYCDTLFVAENLSEKDTDLKTEVENFACGAIKRVSEKGKEWINALGPEKELNEKEEVETFLYGAAKISLSQPAEFSKLVRSTVSLENFKDPKISSISKLVRKELKRENEKIYFEIFEGGIQVGN